MVGSSLDFIKSLAYRSNVHTLSLAELDQEASLFGRPTQNQSLSFYSHVRNRSAGLAGVCGGDRVVSNGLSERQQAVWDSKDDTLRGVRAYLERAPLVRVQRTIGDNPSFKSKCFTLLSVQRAANIRQAHLWSRTLRDHDPSATGRDLVQVCNPEWPENDRQVLVFPEQTKEYTSRLKEERREYLAGFPGLNQEVVYAYD